MPFDPQSQVTDLILGIAAVATLYGLVKGWKSYWDDEFTGVDRRIGTQVAVFVIPPIVVLFHELGHVLLNGPGVGRVAQLHEGERRRPGDTDLPGRKRPVRRLGQHRLSPLELTEVARCLAGIEQEQRPGRVALRPQVIRDRQRGPFGRVQERVFQQDRVVVARQLAQRLLGIA